METPSVFRVLRGTVGVIQRTAAVFVMGIAATAGVLGAGPAALADPRSDTSTTVSRPTPATVELAVRTMHTPGRNGENGTILMQIGSSAPIRVIVDTGFSGLLIFPGAWNRTPSGVRIGKQKASVAAPHGKRIPGVIGTATMTFGGVTTAQAIPFVYGNTPSAYLKKWTDMRVYGLLGIGTKGGDTMVNPFTALPGNLGRQWSIHFARAKDTSGSIRLGAPPPPDSVMTFPLPYVGTNAVGAPLWNDQSATGCWSFGGTDEVCVPTWFDAAFTLMRVKGEAFADLPTDARGYLATGTEITLAAPGAAFVGHAFTAGSRASRNLVKVLPNGDPLINTGNSFYFDYTLSYDLTIGRVSLSDKGA